MTVFGDELWLKGLFANTSMFQQFVGIANFDNIYWSLTVELAFYLNVAWLFALGLHKYPLRCVAVWLCLSGIWALAVVEPRGTERDWYALLTALDCAPYFAIGIVFYQAQWRTRERALIVLALTVEYLIASWEGVAVAAGVLALMFGALKGHLRFLVSPATLWLGSISYALYLIHRNLGYHTLTWLSEHEVGPIVGIAVTTIGALAAATLVTVLVEKPASRFIRSRYRALTIVKRPGLASS